VSIEIGVVMDVLIITAISILSGCVSSAVIYRVGRRRSIDYDWWVLCLSITIIVFVVHLLFTIAVRFLA
jgi:hypothetical protein